MSKILVSPKALAKGTRFAARVRVQRVNKEHRSTVILAAKNSLSLSLSIYMLRKQVHQEAPPTILLPYGSVLPGLHSYARGQAPLHLLLVRPRVFP